MNSDEPSIKETHLNALRTEGSRAIDDLCEMAETLGYKDKYGQLICNNGAAVSSFLYFLENNPGAVEAIYDWVRENYLSEDDEE